MFYLSDYTEHKNIWDLKYMFRMVLLILITINFGVKSQFYIEEKTLLGSLQFIGALILLHKTATLK